MDCWEINLMIYMGKLILLGAELCEAAGLSERMAGVARRGFHVLVKLKSVAKRKYC